MYKLVVCFVTKKNCILITKEKHCITKKDKGTLFFIDSLINVISKTLMIKGSQTIV